jgi:hypothetical protein
MGAGRTHLAHRLHVHCPGIRRFESGIMPLAFILMYYVDIYFTPILDIYPTTCVVS